MTWLHSVTKQSALELRLGRAKTALVLVVSGTLVAAAMAEQDAPSDLQLGRALKDLVFDYNECCF